MKALVTGGVQGLGKCFTEELINRGYKVYALYHKSINDALILEDKYENIRCIKCDITNEKEVENTLFNIDDLDIIINNAAIARDNEYYNKSKKEFMDVLETNVVGTFLVIKYALEKLNKNGVIINISSNNTIDSYSSISMDYDASKAGVNMLTKDFALLLDNKKIISICPGWIETTSINEMNQKYLEEELKRVKQKKLIDPNILVKYILDNIYNYNNGEIVEIKEL